MNCCGICKHWGKSKFDTSSEKDNERFCFLLTENKNPLVHVGAMDDYGLQVITNESFCCACFENV